MGKNKKQTILVSLIIIIITLIWVPAQTWAISAGNLVTMTNSARAQAGLKALNTNSQLIFAANMKASDMITKDYWAHTSPDGLTPWYWMKQAGYDYTYAGENLAVDFSDDSTLFSAWMASASHRANVLDPRYQEIGIAAVFGNFQGRNTIIVVQMFGTRATTSNQIAPKYNRTTNQNINISKEPEKVYPPEYFEKSQEQNQTILDDRGLTLLEKIKNTLSDLKKPKVTIPIAIVMPSMAVLPYAIEI